MRRQLEIPTDRLTPEEIAFAKSRPPECNCPGHPKHELNVRGNFVCPKCAIEVSRLAMGAKLWTLSRYDMGRIRVDNLFMRVKRRKATRSLFERV